MIASTIRNMPPSHWLYPASYSLYSPFPILYLPIHTYLHSISYPTSSYIPHPLHISHPHPIFPPSPHTIYPSPSYHIPIPPPSHIPYPPIPHIPLVLASTSSIMLGHHPILHQLYYIFTHNYHLGDYWPADGQYDYNGKNKCWVSRL